MKRKMKPVHPGAILREDVLKEMDLSVTEAARGLGVSRKQLSHIINEKASISPEMAVRLQQGFGGHAEFWLNLQAKFDLWEVENSGQIHVVRLTKVKSRFQEAV